MCLAGNRNPNNRQVHPVQCPAPLQQRRPPRRGQGGERHSCEGYGREGYGREGYDREGYRRRMTVTTRPKICTSLSVNTIGCNRGLAGTSVTVLPLR